MLEEKVNEKLKNVETTRRAENQEPNAAERVERDGDGKWNLFICKVETTWKWWLTPQEQMSVFFWFKLMLPCNADDEKSEWERRGIPF